MDSELKKTLKTILDNQKMLSLAIRRLYPYGENVTTPELHKVEDDCNEAIQNLK
jgi:hypothetical protein